ncbi:MAG: DUF3570 domain-containing protein [Myxococcales bacterium]|nr:DUF3570 domain-containing protein [Myxococcales bacterium]
MPSDATTLTLHYRYYAQGEATFYRPRYFDFADGGGYLTRDRKLSAFLAHEVGAALGARGSSTTASATSTSACAPACRASSTWPTSGSSRSTPSR